MLVWQHWLLLLKSERPHPPLRVPQIACCQEQCAQLSPAIYHSLLLTACSLLASANATAPAVAAAMMLTNAGDARLPVRATKAPAKSGAVLPSATIGRVCASVRAEQRICCRGDRHRHSTACMQARKRRGVRVIRWVNGCQVHVRRDTACACWSMPRTACVRPSVTHTCACTPQHSSCGIIIIQHPCSPHSLTPGGNMSSSTSERAPQCSPTNTHRTQEQKQVTSGTPRLNSSQAG